MTAGKNRDQAFNHARIFYEVVQQRFIAAFEEAFEINQGTFWVRGGGERSLEVRLDGGEGFVEEGGEGEGHEGIILFASRLGINLPLRVLSVSLFKLNQDQTNLKSSLKIGLVLIDLFKERCLLCIGCYRIET